MAATDYFDLVPALLKDGMYIDISRAEIGRLVRVDGIFDREYVVDVRGVEIPIRIVVQQGFEEGNASLAILVHEIRVAGIDHEVRYLDQHGQTQRGWHRHVWNKRVRSSKEYKEALLDFEAQGLDDFLIRAFKELRISVSGRDYGEPELPFDQG